MGTIIQGLLIPFIGTTAGAAMVFLLRNEISPKLQKILTGFAAGVMVAASFWSLLSPALEESSAMGKLSFIPASIGFLVGVGLLLLIDKITPHMHMDRVEEGPKTGLKRTTKLILAVTIHNIPEGMAVGVMEQAISLRRQPLLLHLALPFKTFLREPLSPCHLVLRE